MDPPTAGSRDPPTVCALVQILTQGLFSFEGVQSPPCFRDTRLFWLTVLDNYTLEEGEGEGGGGRGGEGRGGKGGEGRGRGVGGGEVRGRRGGEGRGGREGRGKGGEWRRRGRGEEGEGRGEEEEGEWRGEEEEGLCHKAVRVYLKHCSPCRC